MRACVDMPVTHTCVLYAVHVSLCMSVCSYIYTSIFLYFTTYVCVHACLSVCVRVQMFTRMCLYAHVAYDFFILKLQKRIKPFFLHIKKKFLSTPNFLSIRAFPTFTRLKILAYKVSVYPHRPETGPLHADDTKACVCIQHKNILALVSKPLIFFFFAAGAAAGAATSSSPSELPRSSASGAASGSDFSTFTRLGRGLYVPFFLAMTSD